jgi:hypothetical protein
MTTVTPFKVLTANRLSDGIAVWLGADGAWHDALDEAFVARHEEALSGLRDAERVAAYDNAVVDINIIDVDERDGHIFALRLRERIRAGGPTVAYGAEELRQREQALAA